MSSHVVSVIKEYVSTSEISHWPPKKKESLYHLLADCFRQPEIRLQWKKFNPRIESGTLSYRRSVYLSSPDSRDHQWMIKLETSKIRNLRIKRVLPHMESIAYEISRLFGGDSVPKTKVVHQWDKDRQNAKYLKWMKPFVNKTYPITCTFQTFIKGRVLPSVEDIVSKRKKLPEVDLSSYQQVYLLTKLIFCMSDARADNFLYCPATRRLHAIDNEFFRMDGGESILDIFKKQKNEAIRPEVLKSLLRVNPDDLDNIQNKYTLKDRQLLKFWKNEPELRNSWGKFFDSHTNSSRDAWKMIRENLLLIQEITRSLLKNNEHFTMLHLETAINEKRKAKDSELGCLIT